MLTFYVYSDLFYCHFYSPGYSMLFVPEDLDCKTKSKSKFTYKLSVVLIVSENVCWLNRPELVREIQKEKKQCGIWEWKQAAGTAGDR